MQEFIEIPANRRSISKRKPICGVGINDASYITNSLVLGKKVVSLSYKTWKSMIERCYSVGYQKRFPTYVECFVCDEWLYFSNFDSWYKDNFIEGYDLDKDLKVKGNKVYSPSTCIFIPQSVNKLFNECKSVRGKFPTGVSFSKSAEKYQSAVKYNGKRVHLGFFDSPELAREAYKQEKNKEIKRQAEIYPELKQYLMNHLLEE